MVKDKRTGSLPSYRRSKAEKPQMIEIPGGPFLMGTSDDQVIFLLSREEWAHDWYENDMFLIEQPQFTLEIPTFYIAIHPVTNQAYYQFLFKTGYKSPKSWIGFQFGDGEEDHPVTGISKLDALEYISWLNKQTGNAYRLPTEAEWEKACRGEDDRIYPWGNDFDPWRCNTQESGKANTTIVGSYSPSGDSPYGVADMVGNVWEWTSNTFSSYPYTPEEERVDPDNRSSSVVRGGAWYYSRKLARCSARESVIPTYTSDSIGFRLALDIR